VAPDNSVAEARVPLPPRPRYSSFLRRGGRKKKMKGGEKRGGIREVSTPRGRLLVPSIQLDRQKRRKGGKGEKKGSTGTHSFLVGPQSSLRPTLARDSSAGKEKKKRKKRGGEERGGIAAHLLSDSPSISHLGKKGEEKGGGGGKV